MKPVMSAGALLLVLCLASPASAAPGKEPARKKIMVVSSYSKAYLWSQETNRGFCDAMLKFGYFDHQAQAEEFGRNDEVETSRVIVKRMWMDSKKRSKKDELLKTTAGILRLAKQFKPDFILLGDDEAAQYIGPQFLDTGIPVVFWGLNHTPVKYGIVDREERPGHNITGVYQSGYHVEAAGLMKKIRPGIKRFAILTDDTPSGRSNLKAIEYHARRGDLGFTLVESVSTNDAELWKRKALDLQKKVDFFFVAQYSGLKDQNGNPIPDLETSKWYLTHITIPEVAGFRFRVAEGMLCAADDSGYNQAFEAVSIARDIWTRGMNPARYPSRAPRRGAFVVNRQRAEMLGIRLTPEMGIEELIERAEALKGEP